MAILKRTHVKVKVQYAGGSSETQGGSRHQVLINTGNIQILHGKAAVGETP